MSIKHFMLPALIPVFLLIGCAGEPTLGERMQSASAQSGALANRWSAGDRLVRDGRELIEDGKERVSEGEDMIEQGEDLIEKGRKAIDRGRKVQREGAEKVSRGQAAMEEAERSYAETYPDLYRQISLPAGRKSN